MNITEFLKTGEYLNLAIGMPEVEIYSLISKKQLGNKNYFDKNNKKEGYTYFYTSLEIMIINSNIYSIGFDLSRGTVVLCDTTISENMSFELILRCLDIYNIKWSFYDKYCYQRELAIKTEGEVILGCSFDKGEYTLSKIKKW